ncbi:MAG: pantoate--beta-alanine ligase, partial [Clostridiales bacterium]|nr:pantoate--beta-alanine ligase [Clostridiales bacterium]
GVCTVVAKLFNIVQPDRAFFGEKDAQQLAVIRKMVRDMSYGIEIVGCPIVRELDGLAKSSRNTYLNAEERKAALCLSRAIGLGKRMVLDGERDARCVVNAMTNLIMQEPLAKIDYVQAVDGVTMEPTDDIYQDVLVAMAVYIGKTRLIDNFSVRL